MTVHTGQETIIGRVARRVSSPVFVGRRAELERIAADLDAASNGQDTFLLIAGEAGVGKTRLLDEAIETARGRGFAVGIGRCVEMGVPGVPFAPIRSAVREVLAAADGEAPDGAEQAAPDMLPRPGPMTGERIGVGPDSTQARAFEAYLDILRGVSERRPVLLVVEDIHWAEPSTLDLLGYLAQGLWNAPIVLGATFRSDELHRRHPLQPFLGEIQRARSTERIDLDRFSMDEVAQQVSAILGETASQELVGRVFRRSDGNAFYSEELVVAEESGSGLPPQMRDVLLARVATLSDPARELVRTAAAGGARVATALVADVAGTEPEDLDLALRETVDRNLIAPVEADGQEYLVFRHALVQEAIYAELLPGERSRLHARYGAALEAMPGYSDMLSSELAYHWFAAHDLPRALQASVEAGSYAASSRAYGDAHHHYERALELWERVPDAADRTGVDRIALLELAAKMAAESDPGRAAALMLEAIRSTEANDPTRLGLLKVRYGRYSWLAGDGLTALEACREGVQLVSDGAPLAAQAQALASLGQILMVTLQGDEGIGISKRAVAAARAAGNAEVECHALDTVGGTLVYLGDLEGGLTHMTEAVELAMRIGSIDEAIRAQSNIIDALAHSGRLAEAADEADAAFAFADANGLGRAVGAIDLAEGGLALYRLGSWERARAMLERGWRLAATGVPRIMMEERLAMVDVGQGRHDEAGRRLASVRPLLGRVVEGQLLGPLAEAAAEMALARGDPAAARTEIASVFERVTPVPGYISRLGPLLALGVRTEADLSELARARHDDDSLEASRAIAAGYVDTMRGLTDAAVGGLPNFLSQAEAWLALCAAELGRLEGLDDASAWDRASTAFEAIPMAYPRAYSLWRSAGAILATGRDKKAAAHALADARAIAADLGAVPLLDQIDALARRARVELDAPQDVQPLPASPSDSLGLTQREREILALVADGRSNREIAEALFITEGTAGTHVSNILGKLGVRGRTEAAALAYRLGLVE
jgi:DNA-binding CsgD family transcriptional regulator/tetratricopeptide (TPR) repeat protein